MILVFIFIISVAIAVIAGLLTYGYDYKRNKIIIRHRITELVAIIMALVFAFFLVKDYWTDLLFFIADSVERHGSNPGWSLILTPIALVMIPSLAFVLYFGIGAIFATVSHNVMVERKKKIGGNKY